MRVDKTALEDILFDADVSTESIHWEYSGRYMYGEGCFGFSGTIVEYGSFLVQAANNEDYSDLAYELAQNVRTDSMGRDSIFYFPGLVVTDGDE